MIRVAYRGLTYCSSVSGPVSGFGSRSDEMGVAVRIVSYSVTTTTPGTGSSITSMIVSSTGTSTTCLGAFLGAFLAAIFDGRCFLAMGFAAPLTARWTLDFAFFGVVRFAAFLRAGSALALPRFELFLRVATRFFALAMIVPCEYAASTPISNQANYADIILSVIRHATFIPHPADNTLHDARERQKARTTRRSRNSTEFRRSSGRSRRKHRAEGCGVTRTIRLTRFVVGETLILSARMPMTLRHGTCDREVEMTPPTQTAAATAEVDVRASA